MLKPGKRLNADTVLLQCKEASPAIVEGRDVVLSIHSGAYFDFNEIASEIWDLLSRPRRVGEILEILASKHHVGLALVTDDVSPFLQMLVERRLAVVLEPKTGS